MKLFKKMQSVYNLDLDFFYSHKVKNHQVKVLFTDKQRKKNVGDSMWRRIRQTGHQEVKTFFFDSLKPTVCFQHGKMYKRFC